MSFVDKMIVKFDTEIPRKSAPEFVELFKTYFQKLAENSSTKRKTSYLNSAQSYISQFKKKLVLREPAVSSQFLTALKLDTKDTKKLLREKSQRVHESSTGLVVLEGDQMIKDGRQFLLSENKYEQLIGLAILTGRRCGELLFSATFRPPTGTHATNMKYWCKINGLLKKRGKACADIEVPFLAPVKLILTTIVAVRKQFPCSNQEEANRKYARGIANNVKKLFPKIGKIHHFRNVYAALCFHYFNENNCSIARLTGNYLGHESTSATVLTYLNSIIRDVGTLDFSRAPLPEPVF